MRCIDFIGAMLDSTIARAYLPLRRFQNMRTLVYRVTIRHRISLELAFPYLATWPHAHTIHQATSMMPTSLACLGALTINDKVTVPTKVLGSFFWWTKLEKVQVGILSPTPKAAFITVGFLLGWGAHMGDHMAHSIWTPWSQLTRPWGSLSSLQCLSPTHPVQTCSVNAGQYDNSILYEQQGEMRQWNWCIKHHVTLPTAFLPG